MADAFGPTPTGQGPLDPIVPWTKIAEPTEPPWQPHDPVNHPSHYRQGGIEVIEAIEAWELGFCLGNTVKYVARAGKKDPTKTLEDLKKARWYLDREIGRYADHG